MEPPHARFNFTIPDRPTRPRLTPEFIEFVVPAFIELTLNQKEPPWDTCLDPDTGMVALDRPDVQEGLEVFMAMSWLMAQLQVAGVTDEPSQRTAAEALHRSYEAGTDMWTAARGILDVHAETGTIPGAPFTVRIGPLGSPIWLTVV